MPRSNDDFEVGHHTALEPGSKCQQGNCTNDATYFDWHAGAFCSDCLSENRQAARGR